MQPTSRDGDDRINLDRDEDVAYWSEKLGVQPDHLRATVREVGPLVRDVLKHIDPRNRMPGR
jgi:hypothetical protein